MASKDTPKKLYKKRTESKSITRCRLCNRITDPGHSKDIYREQNRIVLRNAKVVYGANLSQDNNLPHLICAPCEGRLNYVVQFSKKVISDTQQEPQKNLRTN